MQATFALFCISLVQYFLHRLVWLSNVADNPFYITSFTKFQPRSNIPLALCLYACFRLPLQIEITFAEPLNYFELVCALPWLSCIVLEIVGKVWLDHRASELFCSQTCKAFPHEFEDNMLVRIVGCWDVLPVVDRAWFWCWRGRCLFWLGGGLFRFFVY